MKICIVAILFLITLPPVTQATDTVDALDDTTVAIIGGQEIPYDWFLHEFRSTFYRHVHEEDIRKAVFDQFLTTALVFEAARAAKIDQDPELQEQIQSRIESMRAYMEYQLAMTERGMIIEAYLSDQGLAADSFSITDEELLLYIQQELSTRPNSPEVDSLDDVPPQIQQQFRSRWQQEQQQHKLQQRQSNWLKEFDIEINEALIQSVPLPRMRDGQQAPFPLPND